MTKAIGTESITALNMREKDIDTIPKVQNIIRTQPADTVLPTAARMHINRLTGTPFVRDMMKASEDMVALTVEDAAPMTPIGTIRITGMISATNARRPSV